MAWYYGTYSCGHEGRTNVIGPEKDRQRKADWEFEKECPECREASRKEAIERENEEALKASIEMELPELTGTEKQVAWANTIRKRFIDQYEQVIEKAEQIKLESPKSKVANTIDEFQKVFDYVLNNKVKASYWIDNRFEKINTLLQSERENVPDNNNDDRDILEESTVYPENKKTDAVVKIKLKHDSIVTEFEKNNDFITVVKGLGYKWDGDNWVKNITETTGSAEERAAELGNKLLNAGFPIAITDDDVRNNAINGNFEPECTNWIIERNGKLVIKWKGYSDKLYSKAKSLPGAKWNEGMVINVAHYMELEEFAELYGFKFTKSARALIDKHIAKMNELDPVSPAKIEEPDKKDGLQSILESSDDILDDLKD